MQCIHLKWDILRKYLLSTGDSNDN
jgi:hypothetical protein